jgi:hypothetical protein
MLCCPLLLCFCIVLHDRFFKFKFGSITNFFFDFVWVYAVSSKPIFTVYGGKN